MAKIENTTVYPTVTPAMDDLLIATDVSNNNETVTFLISDLIGGTGVLQGLQSVLDTGNTAVENINLTGDISVAGTIYPTTITASGTTGIAGQILSSTAAGIQWINSPSVACCSWNDSLSAGNTAIQKAIVDGATLSIKNAGGNIEILDPAYLTVTGPSTFSNTVAVNSTSINFNATGQISDGSGSTGTAGYFLTSTGTGLAWSNTLPSTSCCTLQDTIAAGNTSNNQSVDLSGSGTWVFGANVLIDSSGNNEWKANNKYTAVGTAPSTAAIDLRGTLSDGTGVGAAGQVLTSTGVGVAWGAASGGTQDLQSVLDNGNIATGAGATINITGTLEAGSITDSGLSTGGANQYLTAGPTGGSLVWTAAPGCCNLQDVLTVGNSATTSIALTGVGINVSAPIMIPTQIQDGTGGLGLAGQYLTVDATATGLEWTTAAASGVTSLVTATGASTGTPFSVNAPIGNITMTSHSYAGTTNVGYVPTGGSASTFLRGDGTWVTPAGSAVIDVDETTVGTSTGIPINVNPTTGNVLVQSMAYNGGSNVGHVPSGGSGSTYLRGDGTWATPSGGGGPDTNTWMETYTNRLIKLAAPISAGDYYTQNAWASSGTMAPCEGVYDEVLAGAPNLSAPSDVQRFSASLFTVPQDGCAIEKPVLKLCGMSTSATTAPIDTSPMNLIIEVWTIPGGPCDGTDIYLAGSCTMNMVTAGVPVCCENTTWTAYNTMQPGDSLMLTWRVDQDVTSDSTYMYWKCTLRGEWQALT